MFELTAKIVSVMFTGEGKPLVTLEFEDRSAALEMVDALKGLAKICIKFLKFTKKRSLDANAYAWSLIGKIAERVKVPKNDVYMQLIREIGDYDIVCIKEEAASSLRQAWEGKGLGWQTEETLSKFDGCTNVLLWYGSSCYTTEQMSRFIDYIQQECKDLGIEVRPQEEIDALLNSWEGKF